MAKLLVVDVGAGSTDVGYMLKTNNLVNGSASFYYFHPASTFAEAGDALTKSLIKHYRAQGRPITWAEAEAQKVSQKSWQELSFVKLWIRHICDHVQQYLEGVPDERWLPVPVTLHVVVTGGSGLISALREGLHDAVVKAMKARRFERGTVQAVQMVDKYQPRFSLPTEAGIARMAVCIGAADPDKPSFRYVDKMDRPSLGKPVMAGPRWT